MKINNFLNRLISVSKQSVNVHKHAAVLLLNGKPIIYNFNSIQGIKSIHAEIAVIRNYLNLHRIVKNEKINNKTKRLMRNVAIFVIRYSGNKLTNSKPCMHCINYMKKIGIKKVYYSKDEKIFYEKMNSIQSDHVSLINRLSS